MNRKGEATVGSVVIGVLIFFAVFIIFSHFYGDLRSNYDITVEGNTSSKFYETFEGYSDDVYGFSKEMYGNASESKVETFEQATGLQIVTKSIWRAITIIFKFPSIFYALITDFSILIGIPSWLMSVILGIVITFIVFLVVSVAMRWYS